MPTVKISPEVSLSSSSSIERSENNYRTCIINSRGLYYKNVIAMTFFIPELKAKSNKWLRLFFST